MIFRKKSALGTYKYPPNPDMYHDSPNSRSNTAAVQDVILRHCTKVGDVDQQLRDSDEGKGNRVGAFDRTYGVADFGESIICLAVTRKRPEISPGVRITGAQTAREVTHQMTL